MKIYDILNPYKLLCESEILEETLSTDFSIGFELEGVCTKEPTGDDMLPSYHSGREPRGLYKELKDQIDAELGFGQGKIESDGSLHASSDRGGRTFEYGSPIIPFNPTNINKIYKFLKKLPEFDVYTNDSCGFHTHMSFTGIDKTNVAWVICCMAIDDKLSEELTELKGDQKVIPFTGYYANRELMDGLKRAISQRDYDRVKNLLDSDTKYTYMRLHPAGTLEWRGPRNFLNDNDTALIHEYIMKVYRVILKITQILHAKTWSSGDITLNRDYFDKNIQIRGDFESPEEKRKKAKTKSLDDKISDDPKFILKLSPQKLAEVLNNSSYLRNNVFREWGVWGTLQNEYNDAQIKAIITVMNRHYDFENYYDFKKFLKRTVNSKERLQSLPSDIKEKYINARLIDYLRGYEIGMELMQILDIKSPEMMNRVNDIVKNAPDDEFKSYITRLESLEVPISLDVYKRLLNGRYFYLFGEMNNIPVKVQRMMLRKSPYMIQYIQNPDPDLVANLKKKYPDIENYIAGVKI